MRRGREGGFKESDGSGSVVVNFWSLWGGAVGAKQPVNCQVRKAKGKGRSGVQKGVEPGPAEPRMEAGESG